MASLFAITLLVKLYDLYKSAPLGLHLRLGSYLAYLPNGFWLVLRRVPSSPPKIHDLRRLGYRAPAAVLSVLLCIFLYRMNWSTVSFAVEHVLKVFAVVLGVVLLTNTMAAVYRLLGGVALDFMSYPLIASTSADFWRRWNVPAHEFLNEYAFMPAGGPRRAVRATLVTFGLSGMVHEYLFGIATGRVQGWQLLFFMLQGLAVAATLWIRPRGRVTPLWIAATWVFNMASAALFFKSVNQILPFYWASDS